MARMYKTTIYLDADTRSMVDELREEFGISFSDVIRMAIRRWWKEEFGKEAKE